MKQAPRVRDYMTASPTTATPTMNLNEAFDLMLKHNVRELPVVEHGKVVAPGPDQMVDLDKLIWGPQGN